LYITGKPQITRHVVQESCTIKKLTGGAAIKFYLEIQKVSKLKTHETILMTKKVSADILELNQKF